MFLPQHFRPHNQSAEELPDMGCHGSSHNHLCHIRRCLYKHSLGHQSLCADLEQTTIFSCSPVSNLWNPRALIFPHGCVNIALLQFVLALISAVSDFLVMWLPLVLIKRTMIDERRRSESPFLSNQTSMLIITQSILA
jgi:hypothetical protein